MAAGSGAGDVRRMVVKEAEDYCWVWQPPWLWAAF
jgi:hypothetical protein